MSTPNPSRQPAGSTGGGQFATQHLSESDEVDLAAENAALTQIHTTNEARLDAEVESVKKTGRCVSCSVAEHEMCSATPGCSCCEDTAEQMESEGLDTQDNFWGYNG